MAGAVRVGLVRLHEVRFHPRNVRDDLGDLRKLTASIRKHGVLQPVVVEEYAGRLRLRAGHRRVAAARLAGLTRIPAMIHAEALDDLPWLVQAVEENVNRRQLSTAEKRRAVEALRAAGCSWRGIGETFGVSPRTAAAWVTEPTARTSRQGTPRSRATRRLVEAHRAEFDQLLEEEKAPTTSTVQDRADHRAAVIAELEELLGTDAGHSIARRLGYDQPTSLARALFRWGRPDLARRFQRGEAA